MNMKQNCVFALGIVMTSIGGYRVTFYVKAKLQVSYLTVQTLTPPPETPQITFFLTNSFSRIPQIGLVTSQLLLLHNISDPYHRTTGPACSRIPLL